MLLSCSLRDLKEVLNSHAVILVDVAHLAGVPDSIVTRAESISKEFFADLQEKLAKRRRSKLSSIAQAGASYDLNVDNNPPKSTCLMRGFLLLGCRFCFPRQRVRSEEQGASGG
jgi:hypothetical protein